MDSCRTVSTFSADATPFGRALLETVPRNVLEAWSKNPKVTFGHHAFPVTKSLFDAFEDKDTGDLLALASAITNARSPVQRPSVEVTIERRMMRAFFAR